MKSSLFGTTTILLQYLQKLLEVVETLLPCWMQKCVAIFDKHRQTAIRESLDIESLLLRIERSQLRWFGHESRMPQERLPKQTLNAVVSGKMPFGRPRTGWLDYTEDFSWNRLELHPSGLPFVLVDRDVWRLNLELLAQQSSTKSG